MKASISSLTTALTFSCLMLIESTSFHLNRISLSQTQFDTNSFAFSSVSASDSKNQDHSSSLSSNDHVKLYQADYSYKEAFAKNQEKTYVTQLSNVKPTNPNDSNDSKSSKTNSINDNNGSEFDFNPSFNSGSKQQDDDAASVYYDTKTDQQWRQRILLKDLLKEDKKEYEKVQARLAAESSLQENLANNGLARKFKSVPFKHSSNQASTNSNYKNDQDDSSDENSFYADLNSSGRQFEKPRITNDDESKKDEERAKIEKAKRIAQVKEEKDDDSDNQQGQFHLKREQASATEGPKNSIDFDDYDIAIFNSNNVNSKAEQQRRIMKQQEEEEAAAKARKKKEEDEYDQRMQMQQQQSQNDLNNRIFFIDSSSNSIVNESDNYDSGFINSDSKAKTQQDFDILSDQHELAKQIAAKELEEQQKELERNAKIKQINQDTAQFWKAHNQQQKDKQPSTSKTNSIQIDDSNEEAIQQFDDLPTTNSMISDIRKGQVDTIRDDDSTNGSQIAKIIASAMKRARKDDQSKQKQQDQDNNGGSSTDSTDYLDDSDDDEEDDYYYVDSFVNADQNDRVSYNGQRNNAIHDLSSAESDYFRRQQEEADRVAREAAEAAKKAREDRGRSSEAGSSSQGPRDLRN